MKSKVVFILAGTRSPGNLGAVCRAAKAFGFPEVRLVDPRMDPADPEAVRLSHGAEDVLEGARVCDSLRDALDGCSRSCATTARPRDWSRPVLDPGAMASRAADSPAPLGLLFGPEDRGLTNEQLAACDEVVSIPLPSNPGATLSLPQAATILASELSRAYGHSTIHPPARSDRSARGARPLNSAERNELLGEVESTLREIGFRPRPNETRFRGSLRDFLARAGTTHGDRLLLRFVLAQTGKWGRRIAGNSGESP